jgi:hypothetical protein
MNSVHCSRTGDLFVNRLFAFTIAGTLAAAPLAAQQPAAPAAADTTSPATAIHQMKSALHELVTQQEKYWMDHGTYTTDGKALGAYPYAKGAPIAQVFAAGSRGWSGIATHRALKGKSCVIWVGQSADVAGGKPKTMGGVAAGGEGEPVCDAP